MSNYYIVSNELYHHGILGQKWGVRRYQNPDGSLTAAGRERYNRELADIGYAKRKADSSGQDYRHKSSMARVDAVNENLLKSTRSAFQSRAALDRYDKDNSVYRNKIAKSIAYKEASRIAKETINGKSDNKKADAIISKFYDGKELSKEEYDYAYKHLDTLCKNHAKAIGKAEKFLYDNYDDRTVDSVVSKEAINAITRYIETENIRNDYSTMVHLTDVLENSNKKLPKSAYAYT